MAQNQKKYLYEEVSKVWYNYNNEVLKKGGVKYPEFTFHLYLSSGMALKQEAKPSASVKGLLFVGWRLKAIHRDLKNLYSDLCKRTLSFRFNKYQEIFDKNSSPKIKLVRR